MPPGARVQHAAGLELAADPASNLAVGETLPRRGRAALLDPGRDRDQQARRGPLVGVGVERDVEPLGAGIVDELEHLLGRPGERGPVVEVGDVGGRAAAPPDVDRLPERVEEAVAERVAHVRVVDAVEARGLGSEIRAAPRRRVRAGRVVEAGRDPVRALLHRLPEHRAHLGDIGVARLNVRPARRREPERGVPDEEGDVDADPGVEPLEVLLDRCPVELDLRVAVEAGVHLDQLAHVGRDADRGIGQPIDADDLGRHALGDLRLVQGVREQDRAPSGCGGR